MKWIIQTNLSSAGAKELIDACKNLGIEYEGIDVIPFDPNIPDIISERAIFYGGTNFVTNIWRSRRWSPGVFFDEENFTFSSYMKNWDVLNSEATITTFDKAHKENIDPDTFVFIRPNKDLKEFAGEVIKFKDLISWQDKVSMGGGIFDSSCKIVISEPYGISDEWRLFIVDKNIITGSHYRSYGRLEVNQEIPEVMLDFVRAQISKWNPAAVYVLDVCRCGDKFYVIEANCFNSSGFYASDVEKIVSSVTSFAEKL